jgi:hypothetical protein
VNRRLLVIGNKLPRLPSIEWKECQHYNFLDYQGLLFDCRKHWPVPSDNLPNHLFTFLKNGHTVYVILPEAAELSIQPSLNLLPNLKLQLQKLRGTTLKLSAPHLSLFVKYVETLDAFDLVIHPTVVTNPNGATWQNTVVNNVNDAVCGVFFNSAFIFHPPSKGRDNLAFKAIIDHFNPDLEEPDLDPAPPWATHVVNSLEDAQRITAVMKKINHQIGDLQEKLREEELRMQALERWVQLLWLDGVPLQNRVKEVFDFLGFTTESIDPTGHTRDLVIKYGGREFLIEVTGSTGPITLDKGRQLLQWMGDSESPDTVKGLLIGNAFRTHAPDNRPPTPNHKIFVNELEAMALRYHFGLLEVRQLFDLLRSRLAGHPCDLDGLCTQLAVDGVIKFNTV